MKIHRNYSLKLGNLAYLCLIRMHAHNSLLRVFCSWPAAFDKKQNFAHRRKKVVHAWPRAGMSKSNTQRAKKKQIGYNPRAGLVQRLLKHIEMIACSPNLSTLTVLPCVSRFWPQSHVHTNLCSFHTVFQKLIFNLPMQRFSRCLDFI